MKKITSLILFGLLIPTLLFSKTTSENYSNSLDLTLIKDFKEEKTESNKSKKYSYDGDNTSKSFKNQKKERSGELKDNKLSLFKNFLRIEIMELKGPPSVYEVIQRRQEKLDDLNLLIQSKRVEGKKLDLLEKMYVNISSKPEPTQEDINKRFKKRIKSLKKRLKKRQVHLKKKLSLSSTDK